MENIFDTYGIEIRLPDEESFLKIKETLTRIGIASKKENTLYQTCHILHKRGKYGLMHFKEMFLIDGKSNITNFTDEDKARRNKIAELLEDWELLEIIHPESTENPTPSMHMLTILNHKEKNDWSLSAKYSIGVKHNVRV